MTSLCWHGEQSQLADGPAIGVVLSVINVPPLSTGPVPCSTHTTRPGFDIRAPRAGEPLHAGNQQLLPCRGRNVEGQCGQDAGSPFLAEPAAVSGLDDAVAAAAGRMHSGAVTGEGHVLTWGEGTSGKLGHGNAEDLSAPTRVESLVHRVDARAMALGHSHSLFLDADGAVYACGENKEVTPLDHDHGRTSH